MRPSNAFFDPAPTASLGHLAILHLKRDSLVPVNLGVGKEEGYEEGAVTNTRFGSFPHSTLAGVEWGSQVRASRVDTGTRGRKGKKGKHQEGGVSEGGEVDGGSRKRKSDASEEAQVPAKKARQEDNTAGPSNVTKDISKTVTKHKADDVLPPQTTAKKAVEAGSGFIHLLQPTPESWTSSLDHRTQVVYTPDYSYILQRLRVKPGRTIIEAGAGSGSFTHAAARAVFSGHSSSDSHDSSEPAIKKWKLGKVCSYEFHEPRVQTLQQEITDHGLDGVVQLTHRDVCNDGFRLPDASSPNTQAIFLDLPAPWLALRHLTRSQPNSPLDPETPVHLCTFSPCIEQVIATVTHLRKAGWTEIEMVEVQNRRIDVRREQVGLKNEGLRGVNASAATVEESIARLKDVERKVGEFHTAEGSVDGAGGRGGKKVLSKQERLEKIKREAEDRKLYKEGNLVHKTEAEVKTHTSYLVFAVLPREWSEEDEVATGTEWGIDEVMKGRRKEEGGVGGLEKAK